MGYSDIHFGYYPEKEYLEKWQEDLKRIHPQLIGIYTTAPQFQFIQKMVQAVSDPGPFYHPGRPPPYYFPSVPGTDPAVECPLCRGRGISHAGTGPGPGAGRGLYSNKKSLG